MDLISNGVFAALHICIYYITCALNWIYNAMGYRGGSYFYVFILSCRHFFFFFTKIFSNHSTVEHENYHRQKIFYITHVFILSSVPPASIKTNFDQIAWKLHFSFFNFWFCFFFFFFGHLFSLFMIQASSANR